MATQHPHLPVPNYFSKYATSYIRGTGRSTLNLLTDIITDNIQPSANPIGPDSIVHDTAAGPAVGAAALVAALPKDQLPKELLVTDNVPMMVTAARDSLADSPLPHVECKELDSMDLSSLPDDHFTHSINNISIFTFTKPVEAVRETYRTLRPGGLAIFTCWRRFAPMLIVHAAQKSIRADQPLMPTPSPEFYEEGVLQRVVEEGGFAKSGITMVEKLLVVSEEEDIAGLTGLMQGPLMQLARKGFSEEEEARWPEAVTQAIQNEVKEFGGIRFEAYALLAVKQP